MKLKKLEINNIASIAKACIDFTSSPLADSPIFLITGETGSGKSTILDAICLALYNKTPRLTNKNSTDENIYKEGSQQISIVSVNQLLKKGEKEGEIDLLFEGADGTDYQARWSCRVNRNGKLEDETWSITDSNGNTDSSKRRDKKMTEIIGLDFDEFCRTSMLAQGQFTQFLKADTKDKSTILEKITGTEIYARIGTRIHQKAKDANDVFKAINKEVDAVTLLPDEVVESHRKEISEIDGIIERNAAAERRLDELAKAFETIEASEDAVKESETVLESAKTKFAFLSADLAYKKLEYRSQMEKADAIKRGIDKQKHHDGMFANVQSIENHFDNIIKQRNIRIAKQDELGKESKNLELASAVLEELGGKKAESENLLAQKNKLVSDATEARNALNPDAVAKERQFVGNWLENVNSAFADYAGIQTKSEAIKVSKADYAKADSEMDAEKEALIVLEAKAADTGKAYDELYESYKLMAQVLDDATVRVREWLRESRVKECPVCHSRIDSIPTTEQELDKLKPILERVNERKKHKDEADRLLTAAKTSITTKESAQVSAKARISSSENELEGLITSFANKYARLKVTGREENAKEILESRKDYFLTRKKTNDDAIEALNIKQKAIDDATTDRDAFVKDILNPILTEYNNAGTKVTEITGMINTCKSLIKTASDSESESLAKVRGMVTYPDWEKDWEADADAFTKRLEADAEAYNTATEALGKASAEMETLKKAIDEASDVHNRILAIDEGFMPENTAPDRYMGNAQMEWGALENSIATAKEGIRKSREAIGASRKILEKAFDADATLPRTQDAIVARKFEISQESIAASGRRGELRKILDDDQKIRAELEVKIKARDEASRQNARWKTLDDMFGGADGFNFKKIAQSYIMQDILNHANAYLRRIAPRYELTAQPGSLVILVKDNEDGGVRSGNTLSGGEGFVISLSLALGLSSLAENSISVDTIFIDEGFGTLSQEWLNSVMAALEKLNSTSGRHVGIISHIEELQKRIPTVIEVRKTNATTSEIVVRG